MNNPFRYLPNPVWLVFIKKVGRTNIPTARVECAKMRRNATFLGAFPCFLSSVAMILGQPLEVADEWLRSWSFSDLKGMEDSKSTMYQCGIAAGIPNEFARRFASELGVFREVHIINRFMVL
jgi:hypothetical protein